MSATLRNFSEKASSRKPSVTFIIVIQSPDFGNCLSADGNMANIIKGSANAKEKANSPIIVPLPPPDATSTSNVPTMGAVHEKLTTTRVRAIRNMDTMPEVLLDFISSALPHD